MKRFFLSALLMGTLCGMLFAQRAERTSYKFDFTAKKTKGDVIAVKPAMMFADSIGYGYDFQPAWDGKSVAPFYFSVNVPDGNYRVTVTLGSKKRAGETTVRGESRRLFVENQPTAKGKTSTHTFIINKRNTRYVNAKGEQTAVRIKDREKTKLNWDNKLTFEFNGTAPCVQTLTVEKVDTVPTVFLCGNSTVVDQDLEPWASWGQMVTRFMDDEVAIANYAESGETADGFIGRGRLAKILSEMKAGDYIFMEFGHNDQKSDKRIGHGAFYFFQYQLKIFVDEARARGAHPVFCTPTMRRSFKDGVVQPTHLDYPEAMRFMGARENIPVIDLQAMTKVFYEAMGEQESVHAFVHYPANTYPNQPKALADNTHFNPFGAYEIAKMVLKGLQDLKHPLAKHILPGFSYDPAQPDDWKTFRWAESPFYEIEKPDGN